MTSASSCADLNLVPVSSLRSYNEDSNVLLGNVNKEFNSIKHLPVILEPNSFAEFSFTQGFDKIIY